MNKCEIMNCDSLFCFNNFLMIFICLRLQLNEDFLLSSRLVDFFYIDVSVLFCLQFKIAFAFIYYVQGFVLWRKTENKLDIYLVCFFVFL